MVYNVQLIWSNNFYDSSVYLQSSTRGLPCKGGDQKKTKKLEVSLSVQFCFCFSTLLTPFPVFSLIYCFTFPCHASGSTNRCHSHYTALIPYTLFTRLFLIILLTCSYHLELKHTSSPIPQFIHSASSAKCKLSVHTLISVPLQYWHPQSSY